MHFLIGVAVAAGCGLISWATAKLQTRWIAGAAVPFLVVMVAGAVFGLALYPFSDLFVAAFSLLAGVALGRVVPPRFRPFLVLLLILSALDVAQNLAFAGPSPGPTAAPDPHFIWVNVRFPLPTGHFNIGFADVVLIAAAAENLRRRQATLALSLLPGVIGISLGEALLSTLPVNPPLLVDAIAASLVLFLTAGYVLTELAVSQTAANSC
ncbi:MAG TPA: hypothetical protein VGT01_03195 [Candidatus Dormibacteraeota bacterium]|nr:hypothetical protein [Candidatus Dormibacteraeota bacterium]HEV2476702.1 hypothetical protein [Candidatus Dormibacteraeota bacterium]